MFTLVMYMHINDWEEIQNSDILIGWIIIALKLVRISYQFPLVKKGM